MLLGHQMYYKMHRLTTGLYIFTKNMLLYVMAMLNIAITIFLEFKSNNNLVQFSILYSTKVLNTVITVTCIFIVPCLKKKKKKHTRLFPLKAYYETAAEKNISMNQSTEERAHYS